MRRVAVLALVATLAACDDDGTSSDQAPLGAWSSSEARLEVAVNGAVLQLRDGNCYGSLGTIPSRVPAGEFTIDGKFTQLTGVAPGYTDYSATFTGNATGDRITMTMNVPALSRTVGPITLSYGSGSALSACLYP